ncbi:MAG: dockerin type I domain-containing protein [Clostridia bacterium]|nr:dockerin type I domain-containing protein [Clostridia bacterium]
MSRLISFALVFSLICTVLLLGASTGTYAQADLTWTKVTPEIFNYNGITYGKGLYVVVGDKGCIMTSTDALYWTKRTSGTLSNLNKVLWNGNIFVAVGENATILSSSDGLIWTVRSCGEISQNSILEDIAWNGKTFAAVGYYTTEVITSPDGIIWTVSAENQFRTIAWNGKLFAAAKDSEIYTSTDAISWTRQLNTPLTLSLNRIRYMGNTFVGIGGFGSIVTSQDGLNWTIQKYQPAYVDDSPSLNCLACSENTYVLVGKEVYVSTDCTNWSTRLLENSRNLYDIVWANNLFVAVGYGGKICISEDGDVWKDYTKWPAEGFTSIVWDGSKYLTLSTGGSALISQDGINWKWKKTNLYNNELVRIIWDGKKYVAAGVHRNLNKATGIICTSADGIFWSTSWGTSYPGPNNVLHDLAYNGNMFVAVGDAGTMVTSLDGVTWTLKPPDTSEEINAITWNGEEFVAAGHSYLATSPDGINWTKNEMPKITGIRSLSGNQNMLVACINYYSIFTSQDGLTWDHANVEITGLIGKSIWTGKEFIVIANDGGFYTSTDGNYWTKKDIGINESINDMAWNGKQYIGVGSNGLLVRGDSSTPSHKVSGFIAPDLIYSDSAAALVKGQFKVEVEGIQKTAYTDANGYFEISGLEQNTGGYTLKISKPNYLARYIKDLSVVSDTSISTAEAPLRMWAGDMEIEGVQDNAINMTDILQLILYFNSAKGDGKYLDSADFNKDNAINMQDILIIIDHFNKTPVNY